MCRAMPFSARALKKKKISFTLILLVVNIKIKKMVYRGLYSYRQRVRVITLFPNVFLYCFCMLSEFEKFFSNSLIIHVALTQPEQLILVRWMGLETQ